MGRSSTDRAGRPAISTSLLFIGTQAEGETGGIFAAEFDDESGSFNALGRAFEVDRPTFLLADPRRPILYAVSELGNAGDREGEVLSLAVEQPPDLRQIGRVGSGGGGPTHLELGRERRHLFVANFGGGQASVMPVRENGALASPTSVRTGEGSGPHRRQQGPHAHGVTIDPSGQFLLVPDMGADRIFIYRVAPDSGALTPAETPYCQLPAGSGPRLILFGADGRFAYLLTELSAEIFSFGWDGETGRLVPVGSVGLDPPGTHANPSAAAFAMSADGRHLYASNRASDEIQLFNLSDGTPTQVQRIAAAGAKPWAAQLSPDERWLIVANQGSDEIVAFRRDPASGRVEGPAGVLSVTKPTSTAFVTTAG